MSEPIVDRDQFPTLAYFLSIAFRVDWDSTYLDPEEAVYDARWNTLDPEEGMDDAAISDEFDRFMSIYSKAQLDRATYELSSAQFPYVLDVPRRPWTEYVTELMERYVAEGRPEDRSADRSSLRAPRASKFTDRETANWAATMAVRRSEPLVRGLYADAIGMHRIYLYAQVDREIGTVVTPGSQQPARAVAVIMSWHVERKTAFILSAYPEIDLPDGARGRWPELSHFLGGYFGQDWRENNETVWSAEVDWQTSTAPEVKELVGRQLDELLSVGDEDELRDTATALGCYVLPTNLRGWLGRIRDRIARPELWTA